MEKQGKIALDKLQIGYIKPILPYILDIEIPDAAFVAIMGVNGRGKSTLLKTIMNFLRPIKGGVIYNQKPINSFNAKELASIFSVVLTDKINVNNITVQQLIAFGRYPFLNWLTKMADEDTQNIHKSAAMCGVAHLLERQFMELSDGERQKVMLAKAVAQDTPVLLLDEPTAHLDIVNKIANFKLLKKMSKEEKRTIIIASHELYYVCDYCDYILLLADDKYYFDTPEKLKQDKVLRQTFHLDL